MPRHIAFLRAINVGGHTVKMDRLRELFEELGLADVETFIASGNVAFTAPRAKGAALETRIERHLRDALGYEVATFVRTPAELAAVLATEPCARPLGEGASLQVAFVRDEPAEEARQRLAALESDVDELHVHGREVYWTCRGRVSDSRISGPAFERALGARATLRNVNTVRRLIAKYGASA